MKILKLIMVLVLSAVVASCSQRTKKDESESGHDHSEMGESGESDHHNEGSESDDHDHGSHEHGGDDSASMDDGEGTIWTPDGEGESAIRSDFHFIVGGMENINPEVTESETGDKILKLSADGTPAAFVFHQSYGNIGMAAMVDVSGFMGSFKLIHHAKDAENHEFVSISKGKMKLGRIVKGEETVFDEGEFESGDGWLNLRVSAAGTHYKGYIGKETVTHGHGDKMENGYVGIMLDGTGTIEIKSIETVPLEDE